MTIKCPQCQLANPETSRFCAECGTQLSSSKDASPEVTKTLETPREELTTGSTFADRYQIIEELGKGGMGKVYRVLDKKLNEEVALKLIKPEIASDKKTLERFSNELKIARKIVHKNVGRMYHLSEERGTYYITMEYVPGENLKSSIRRFGPLPIGKTVFLAKQICQGLAEAHKLGVVHRDLKPGNIMIDTDGNARIMDFGIARSLKERGITGEGMIIGTPEYMSPEQVEGKDIDQQSDIYSLGIILYEMVTGRVPFEGDTPFAVGIKHKSEIPKDPKELNAQIPDELSGVILKCLEKAKEKRYQSAEELDSELARIEGEITATEGAIPKRRPTKSRELAVGARKINWAKIGLYAGAVVVLGVIVYAGFYLFTGRHEVIDSIAVLPFENANADPNTDYLCDGITETIINKLSQLSGFKTVINRASVFTYKGKTVDPKKVGQELGVKAVLLTRMVRLGDRLTVSPTLVRSEDGGQLWGERYERKFEDILSLEENIAKSIVQALRLKVTEKDKQAISARPIDNTAAYEYYLKARQEIERFREDALDRALQYLQNGLGLVGDNALLYSATAYVYFQYVNIGIKQEDYVAKAEEYAKKALALDPSSPKALVILGLIDGPFRGDQKESARHLKKALSLDPNGPEALLWLANLYCQYVGKISAAVPLLEKLKQLDPLNPLVYDIQGMEYFYDGRYDLALHPLSKSYQMDPGNLATACYYAVVLLYSKKIGEASSIIDQMVKASQNNVFTKMALVIKYAAINDKIKLFQEMTPDFKETCKRDAANSQLVASALALIGAKEEAMNWLENAVNRGFINYPLLAEREPFLGNIRGEERFKKLMERVKYEWEHFEE